MTRRKHHSDAESTDQPSRATRLTETFASDIGLKLSDDESLLDFLEKVARSELIPLSQRISAAKEVLPYKYPKLSNIDANLNQRISHEDALAQFADALIIQAHDEAHTTH